MKTIILLYWVRNEKNNKYDELYDTSNILYSIVIPTDRVSFYRIRTVQLYTDK